jgi:hypothetical protein
MNDPGASAGWSTDRWIPILDRIEHRQAHLGLRFWGPPLWLEVTMKGPDSDLWPANIDKDEEWNWQSSSSCTDAARLADEGADDDHILDLVGRYTIENLILNAVHEIGEWLRFDGRRLFPAHPGRTAPRLDDGQGNGIVQLLVSFASGAALVSAATDSDPGNLMTRLTQNVAASRFTYFPEIAVSFERAGPVIRRRGGGGDLTLWRSTWSASTIAGAAAPIDELITLITHDVHRALIYFEANRICQAFHVDGRRPWRLATPAADLRDTPEDEGVGSTPLAISVGYSIMPLDHFVPAQPASLVQ